MKSDLPNLAKWQGRQWAIALITLLLATLTSLLWLQWRQYRMLDDLAVKQFDSLLWQAYQLERESDRLKQSLQDIPASTAPVDPSDLAIRYEVFLSRIDLLTNIPRRDLLSSSLEYSSAIGMVNDFVAFAEPIFNQPQQLVDNNALRNQVVARLGAMDIPLSELTRQANRLMARFVDERNMQLRQQGSLVVMLATLQIVVMLLFVGLLARHIRHQQRQYARLRSLSQALEIARDEAEAANHGKSVFLANMSHEIRTPFQGLLGMLNLLDDASLTRQQRDYLQTARDSAIHLLGVLNDILDVSTMESGTMKLSLNPVHLPGLIQEVDGLMQVAARNKGLALNMAVAATVPEWVDADATRVRQIMFNLVDNAIKFTESGNITAELTLDPQDPSAVLFTVRDTGIGMDAETQQHLFTRFYQADNSPRRRIGGSGLGLEISRNLARMMAGDIAVQSRLGEGSEFTAKLTLVPVDPPPAPLTSTTTPGFSRQLRVLVADDHPINLKYMNILLEKMGHKTTSCENGREVLQLLEQHPFDLVLLDYHMPVLDGLATTQAIRALKGPQSAIKIILVTADVVNDTRKRASEVGVNEFTSKPLQIEALQMAIARCGLIDLGSPVNESIEHPASPISPLAVSADDPLADRQEAAPSSDGLIDHESFEEMLQMMPADSLGKLLKTVFESPNGTTHVLAQSIAAGDREAICYNAHKLKGAAMLMGFRSMVATTIQIEQLAMQTEEPINGDLGQQLLREAALTQEAIARLSSTSSV